MAEYLTCAQTAKLVRAALKQAFPDLRFSVRSKTYSGGASINVSYSGGPCTPPVQAVVNAYRGADFDGMVDLKTYNRHYLLPDGSVRLSSYYPDGTSGPVGVVQALPEGAREVRFGADFIFVTRDEPCGHERGYDCRQDPDMPVRRQLAGALAQAMQAVA